MIFLHPPPHLVKDLNFQRLLIQYKKLVLYRERYISRFLSRSLSNHVIDVTWWSRDESSRDQFHRTILNVRNDSGNEICFTSSLFQMDTTSILNTLFAR